VATVTIYPASDLTGDGFLANPGIGGQQVWGSYTRIRECILVGGDAPGGTPNTYRAYIRFALASMGTTYAAKATFKYYLQEKNSASANAKLYKITDFGTLDFGDLTPFTEVDYGEVLTPASSLGWISQDITGAVNTDRAAPLTHTALWFYENGEPQTLGHFYSIVAVDNATLKPYLEIVELTAPTSAAVVWGPGGAATLTWTSTTGDNEDGFKIEKSPDYGSTWTQIDTVASGVTTFTDDPRPGHNIYRVRAYKSTYNSDYATWNGLGRCWVIS